MNRVKKLISFVLAGALCLGLVNPAMAVEPLQLSASLDKSVVSLSDGEQEVSLTIKSDSEFNVSSASMDVVATDANGNKLTVSSATSSVLTDCTLQDGKILAATSDGSNATTDTVVTIKIAIDENTVAGTYTVGVQNLELVYDGWSTHTVETQVTTTLTITDPDSGDGDGSGSTTPDTTTYELSYKLTDADGNALPGSGTDGYYVADPDATVYAHIYLKSSAAKVLQGYDFFITNPINLSIGEITYTIGEGRLVNSGDTKSTVELTHIQYVGDELEANLPANTEVEIAVISYTVQPAVEYGEKLDITIAAPVGSVNAIAVGGTALSHNPSIVDTVKGIEITKEVTVTFEAGEGGSGTMDPQSVPYHTPTALTPNTFAKTGYSFNGWLDSDNVSYDDEQGVILTSDLTLTAQWKAKTYTVTLDAGEGSLPEGTSGTMEVTYDGTYGGLPSPTDPAGYTFDGWYIEDTKIEASDTVAITENTTLTAKYNPITYTVKFDLNGGSGSVPESITATYDEEIKNLPDGTGLTYENHTFLGWNTDKDATEALSGEKLKTLTTKANDTVTLYAIWSLNAFDVTFNPNGGTFTDGSADSKTEKVNSGNTVSAPTVSKTGYELAYWYYMVGETENQWDFASDTVSGDVTLIAKWTPVEYTVTFDVAGGTLTDGYSTKGTYDAEFTLPTPTKEGYTFKGWNDGKTTHTSATVTNPKGAENKAVTLTAQWEANTYTVKFVGGDGAEGSMADQTFTYGTEQKLTQNGFTKKGYNFVGWKLGDTTYGDQAEVNNLTAEANGTVTLTAQWEVVNYTITYYIDDVQVNNLTPVSYTVEDTVTLPVPTKAFYTFDGWYTDAECTSVKVTEIAEGSTENKTFYAKWTARYKLEDYAYACTGDKLLIIDAAALASGKAPVVDDQQMYYTTDSNYGYAAAYLYIVDGSFDISTITTEDKNEAYVIDKSTGDVNGNGKIDIGDANAVYQMLKEGQGGGYYTYGQVSILGRLIADMSTSTTDATYRGNSYDAMAIVNILNGVRNN